MEIRMVDGSCVVTWERTSAEIHGAIVDRIKSINGAAFDKSGSCWRVPAQQADRLYSAFPKASYCYDAIGAIVDAQERRIAIFGKNLLDMGVMLVEVDGRIVAQGDGVSPLLQQCIDDRGAKLAAWLKSHNARNARKYGQGATKRGVAVSSIQNDISSANRPSDGDLHNAELLANSLRNAAKNQYQEDAMRQQRRRRVKA